MNRLSQVVPRALLLFALGASAVPAGAQAPAPVSKDPGTTAEADLGQPPTDLSPQVFYEYLLAEIAGARGQFGVAVPAYLDLTRRTRDPRIARRATEMALFAHDLPAALEAARIWSETDPDSVEAKRVLAGLLVSGGGGRLAEAQAHLARVLA